MFGHRLPSILTYIFIKQQMRFTLHEFLYFEYHVNLAFEVGDFCVQEVGHLLKAEM